MLIVFITIIFISILLLFSLKYLKKRFDPFEIFLLFMFTSYSSQTFFYLSTSPYDFLRVVEKNLPFWSTRLQFGVILPVLLLWVMYALRGQLKLSFKIIICLSWITGRVLMNKLLLILGVLESKSESWRPEVTFVLGMIILSSSIYFMEILSKVLQREKVIQDEGDI
jgi:hypothetical protein